MTEIVLIGVIVALLAYLGWKEQETRFERNKLINALLAKNATEMANLDLADKTKVEVEKSKEPDFIPQEDLTDEEWKKAIGVENG
ncbi:MAG: hypothetical protein ACOY0S_02400 [Patescibacteria group bacterium]